MSHARRTDRNRTAAPAAPAPRSRLSMITGVLAVVAAVVLAVGGCGGSADKASDVQAARTSASPSGTGETIKTATVGNLGQILVDGEGRTVYMFAKDKGGMSSCSGSCAAVWPPVATSAKPMAGSGADAAKLGTTKRSDGSMQVTYNGHPLYYYAPDGTTAGSAKGEGLNQFGAKWYTVSAAGDAVQPKGGGY